MKQLILFCAIVAILFGFTALQTPTNAATPTKTPTPKATAKVSSPATVAAPAAPLPPGAITAKITAWVLPLRDKPSRAGKMIAKLNHNDVVAVLGINRFRTWLKVQTSDSKTGWISIFYVRFKAGMRSKSIPVVS
jgi:uncharacterized protein YgiM (DUF1202 family)